MRATRKRLNVLHVATINKPITSHMGYGPIETVIYITDKGLTALGHRSIVACSSDSAVTGQKYGTVPRSLGDYLREDTREGRASVDRHLANALARARRGDIDVVHMHEWFEYDCDGRFNPGLPIVTTLHVPGLHSGIEEFRAMHPHAPSVPSMHYVAISEYQRRQYAHLIPVAKTIPHGLDTNEYPFNERPDSADYLFNIGRITWVKGQDSAIDVAKKSGSKLILAGCVQEKAEDKAYFERLGTSIDLAVDRMSAHVDDEVDGRPQAFEVRLVLRLFLDATGENELRARLLRNIDGAVLSLDPSDPADVEEVVCAVGPLVEWILVRIEPMRDGLRNRDQMGVLPSLILADGDVVH